MASADPTAPTVTVHCELGACGRCRGTVLSVTAAHGRPCEHPCHPADTPADLRAGREVA